MFFIFQRACVATLLCLSFGFSCCSVRFECENWPEVTEQREKWLSKIKEITDTPPNFLDEIHNRLSQFQNIKVAEVTKLN